MPRAVASRYRERPKAPPFGDSAGMLIVNRVRDCARHPPRYPRRHGIGDVVPRSAKASAAMYWGSDSNDRTIEGRPAVLPRGAGTAHMYGLRHHANQRPNPLRWTGAAADRFLRHVRQVSNDRPMPAGLAVSKPDRRRVRKMGACSGAGGGFGVGAGVSGWFVLLTPPPLSHAALDSRKC
jgi:hypothetical protein